jgi:hypothetical protein
MVSQSTTREPDGTVAHTTNYVAYEAKVRWWLVSLLTAVSGADSSASVPFPGTFTTDTADNIPPYMNMVWIMRIK